MSTYLRCAGIWQHFHREFELVPNVRRSNSPLESGTAFQHFYTRQCRTLRAKTVFTSRLRDAPKIFGTRWGP